METFSIEDLLNGTPIVREKDFREAAARFPWSDFQGKDVLVRGCGSAIIPAWAYMLATSRLQPHARSIYFGDAASPVLVWSAAATETR